LGEVVYTEVGYGWTVYLSKELLPSSMG
jgi:hypothetical protein